MNYNQYFAIEKRIKVNFPDLERSELIDQFTDGKKSSLRSLTPFEYKEFLKWLQRSFTQQSNSYDPVENKMRRKIISLFVHRMGYTMASLDNWCIKFGCYHKKLNDHNRKELTDLVTQAEKVYDSWISKSRV